jgi:transcriptional regulator with XRE-family HTH domain
MSLTAGQCRAARALLNWSQAELVVRSGVSQAALANFERGASTPYPRTLRDLVETFEKAGIEFLADEGAVGGLGVRFKPGFNEPDVASDAAREAPDGKNGVLKALDAELFEHWRQRPELWAALSPAGRGALSEAIFGDALAAEQAFGV